MNPDPNSVAGHFFAEVPFAWTAAQATQQSAVPPIREVPFAWTSANQSAIPPIREVPFTWGPSHAPNTQPGIPPIQEVPFAWTAAQAAAQSAIPPFREVPFTWNPAPASPQSAIPRIREVPFTRQPEPASTQSAIPSIREVSFIKQEPEVAQPASPPVRRVPLIETNPPPNNGRPNRQLADPDRPPTNYRTTWQPHRRVRHVRFDPRLPDPDADDASHVAVAGDSPGPARSRQDNSRTEQENASLRRQLSRSQATVQSMLEEEFSRLSTQVVAITLREKNNDVAETRLVLMRLSDF